MKRRGITHEFVEYIPDDIQEGVVYVCIQFSTVVHKCLCGCGSKIITPLAPSEWTLIFDGESVSLDPSIGNWSYPCQSHYWIQKDRVVWDRQWSREEIAAGRARDQKARADYLGRPPRVQRRDEPNREIERDPKRSVWSHVKKWFSW
jgi:hypothetical protein